MKDFDKNIHLQDFSDYNGQGSHIPSRLVYDQPSGAEAPNPETERPADKPLPAPEMNVNNPDFDNKNFAKEVKATYANHLDKAITDALNAVPILHTNPESLLRLKNEFSAGLRESITHNRQAISAAVRKSNTSDPRYAQLAEQMSNDADVWTTFQTVLTALKCSSIGLVHDMAKDVTKFKFYAGSNEIFFPQTEIAVHYIPTAVKEATTAAAETVETEKTFTVLREDKKTPISQAIDHVALIEKNYRRPPVEGEWISVKRGASTLKAEYKEAKKQFITTANHPMWFIAGDKVTFYPKTTEKPKESLSTTVDGQEYPIITQIDVPAGTNYLKIAESILDYETGKGAVFNGTQILDDTQASQIIASGINKAEYAYMLQKAHESLPKGSRLPIIIPNKNTARSRAKQDIEKQQEQAAYAQKVEQEQARLTRFDTAAALATVRAGLKLPEQRKLDALIKEYDQKLRAHAVNSEDFNDAWEDFWDEMESFFTNTGFSREVKNSVYLAMKSGKESTAWKNMWLENPTTERIFNVVKQNPNVFGTNISKNSVRNKVWTLVYNIGEGESFDSEDIINVFGIKLPSEMEYEDVLAMAAYQGQTQTPAMASLQKKSRDYASAIEGLGNAIRDMDPNLTQGLGSRQHETGIEKADNMAKDLATLISLLAVDNSTALQREGTNEKPGYSSLIDKGGKRLLLRIKKSGPEGVFEGQDISVHDPDSGDTLFSEFDFGRLDPDAYVDKINSIFSTGARVVGGEKPGEKLETTKVTNKPAYFSLRYLETLNQGTPGIPIKELMESGKKGARRFGIDIDNLNNTLTKGVVATLQKMGVYNSAKFIETPENIREIQGNDSALVNVQYRGRDLTIKFENTLTNYNIYVAPGFNQAYNGQIEAFSEGGKLEYFDQAIHGIDRVISGLSNTTSYMETKNNVERIGTLSQPMNELNQVLAQFAQRTQYPHNLEMSPSQFMELIFRTHSFNELKKEGCINKVDGQPNAYVLAKLPAKLQKLNSNQDLLNLVYSIKYGGHPGKELIALTSSAPEKAREAVKHDEKYRNRLKKLFAYGLTDYDLEGRKITQQDVDVGRESVSYSSKDEYFKKGSGTAAYNDFLLSTRSFTPDGEEIIDVGKANQKLNDYYKKGLAKLDLLKRDPYYNDLAKRVSSLRERTLDLNKDFLETDAQIVRLGYLNYSEMKENEQNQSVEKFREQLISNILSILPETTEGPNGEKVTKEQTRATLKQLPVGVLLSMSYDPNRKEVRNQSNFQMGIHAPIILDVFNSPHAKLVLLPGISNRGLDLVVGLSFTSKDPNWKDQRVIFYGGVSAGATLGPNTSLNAGLSGEIDFKVCKADEKDNFNYYMGITGALGITHSEKGGLVIGGGPGVKIIQWELDAQQMYTNKLNEKYRQEEVKGYLDALTTIYKNGSKPDQVSHFCQTTLKADRKMAQKLGLNGQESDAEVLMKFEQYIALLTEQFNETFDLPAVTGGELSLSVTHGVLYASALATGDVPLILGTTAAWAIQFLASLNFNVGSRMVTSRETKTSDETMNTFNDQATQDQFNKAFEKLQADSGASKRGVEFFTSGITTNDREGNKKTERGAAINSQSTDIAVNQLDQTLTAFNKELVERNIAIRVQKNPDKTIEIVLLESKVGNNERILISPSLVTVRNGKLFLQDPNKLSSLYFNQQSRVYPLETSHGATIETITTISDNRYYKGDSFPTEVSITRYADNKDKPIFRGRGNRLPNQPPVPYEHVEIDRAGIKADRDAMAKALDQSAEAKQETLRPGFAKLAKEVYRYRTKKGETFLSITNDKTKANLENPDYLDNALHGFYQDFEKTKKIDPTFSAYEMRMLTLELSTLRYTDLMAGKTSAAEKAKAYKERLEWAEKTLIPYFQARIDELNIQGKNITHSAADLAKKATQDLLRLDTKMATTNLAPGTSVAIAVGRGVRGLHQIIDGSRNPSDVDGYGYIMGKDYTEALRTATHGNEDYEIGLILMGQLSNLPERSQMKEFMDSNLARKLASNGGLRFIMGSANYREIANYYQTGTGNLNNPGMKQFMDIVTQIRQTQMAGKDSLIITGEKNVKYNVRVLTRVQSGIFNKCGNYSSIINEEISITPPPPEQAALALYAAGSEGRTTLNTKSYKEFTGFFAGVTAAVALPSSGPGGGGGGSTQEGGSGAETDVDTNVEGSPGANSGGASE